MEFYTILPSAPFKNSAVSIPNGMEFYSRSVFAIINKSSFNSQRDGILPKHPLQGHLIKSVSIPNGMEFYATNPLKLVILKERFNSQRDGILQHEFCHFSR